MINLKEYIWLTNMMVLATKDSLWNPYTSNVYFKCDEWYKFYFESKIDREHSKHILDNGIVAWSVLNTEKYKESDKDKKWLQFQWKARALVWDEAEEISKKIYWANVSFTEMQEDGHHIFECNPEKVKIWDEEIYNGDGKLFKF